jgi:hypothetical protein
MSAINTKQMIWYIPKNAMRTLYFKHTRRGVVPAVRSWDGKSVIYVPCKRECRGVDTAFTECMQAHRSKRTCCKKVPHAHECART